MSFRHTHTLDPLVVALLALPACLAAAEELSSQDFITRAAEAGLAQARLGHLAATHGASPEVRSFGRQAMADLEPALARLRTLATALGLAVPAALDAEHERIEQKLQSLRGADFDRQYLATQLSEHDRFIQLLQRQAEAGSEPGLQAFAAEMQPILTRHLRVVKQMTYGGSTGDGRQPDARH